MWKRKREEDKSSKSHKSQSKKPTSSQHKQAKKQPVSDKENIAILCSLLIENPQENVEKLQAILDMCGEDKDAMTRKLAILSLLAVFKDIVPDYRIREITEEEKKIKHTKEVYALWKFESDLLRYYKKYLQVLEKLSRKHELAFTCTKCLCELLRSHPEFNYTSNIISVVVPFLNSSEEKANMVSEYLREVLRTDVRAETSLEVIKTITTLIKGKGYEVKPTMLQLFLSLKLNEALGGSESLDSAKQKSTRKKVKKDNQVQDIEQQLAEAEAVVDKQQIKKTHTAILKSVFTTYFRILKKGQNSQKILLPVVLQGFAKFAHLLNVELVSDLMQAVRDLLPREDLLPNSKLQAIVTAVEVLRHHEGFNIDLKEFYFKFYTILPEIIETPTSQATIDAIPLAVDCIQRLLVQPKLIPLERIGAFIKKLMSVAVHCPYDVVLSILVAVNSIFGKYPRTTQLLDGDNISSGIYLPHVENPDYSNVFASTLVELNILRKHFHPLVAKYAAAIVKEHTSDSKEGPVLATRGILSASQPVQVLKAYDATIPYVPPTPPVHPLALKAKKQPERQFYVTIRNSFQSNISAADIPTVEDVSFDAVFQKNKQQH